MIVMRTPKGWTCPKEIDGKREEGYWRAHQVPMGDMEKPEHVRILEDWMKSYRPGELFDARGKPQAEIAALAPSGTRRMSANPHTNGGALLRDLRLPDFRDYAVDVPAPGAVDRRDRRGSWGLYLRDVMKLNLESPAISACSARTRAIPTAGRTCSRSRTAPGSPRPSTTTTISRPTAG